MIKYFFEEAERETKRVKYGECKRIEYLGEALRVDGTYNAEDKTIEVEVVKDPYSKWELVLDGVKFELYVEKKYGKNGDTTSVYVITDNPNFFAVLKRGFGDYDTYANDIKLDLKKIETIGMIEFNKNSGKALLLNAAMDHKYKAIFQY